jgi:hypothetical protein
MLYLIGGTARSGKTQVANSLRRNHAIAGIEADILIGMFHHGDPKRGIRYDTKPRHNAELLMPFVEGLIHIRRHNQAHYYFEGDALEPELLAPFKHQNHIKIVFLGYPHIDIKHKLRNIRMFPSEENEWTQDLSDRELYELIGQFVDESQRINKACERYEIPFFDTSDNFKQQITQVLEFLTGT